MTSNGRARDRVGVHKAMLFFVRAANFSRAAWLLAARAALHRTQHSKWISFLLLAVA